MESLRVDRLLVYLRFAKTRTRAVAMIAEGYIRSDGARVTKPNHCVRQGSILTIPSRHGVRIVRILELPPARVSAAEACCHYEVLDPTPQSAIAAGETGAFEGKS